MKYLISVLFSVFISGCSVDVIEMSAEPTVQKFDLTDADGDGVVMARDLCAATLRGADIENSGCATGKVEKIRETLLINFDNNSYLVKPEFYTEIKRIADFMEQYPETKVTIEGHTSKLGSKELNQKLSQNRAQAVKDILVNEFAIDKARVTAVGYGFARVLSEGDNEDIHARNRRVVAEINIEKQIKNMKWTIYSVDQPAD
jgi:outer membrane protein OmpA-like peptidoglycan-associated protein